MINHPPVVSAQSGRGRDRPEFGARSLRDLVMLLSTARRVVVACVLASLAAALLFTFMSTPLFTAQSSLLVDSNKGQLSRSSDETSNFGVEIAEIET